MDEEEARFVASIDARRVLTSFAVLTTAVFSLGLLADLLLLAGPGQTTVRILGRLSLGTDNSLPTWVASILLLCCAVLLATSARMETSTSGSHARIWWMLSVIFCLLSLDEVAMFHELSGQVLERILPSVSELGGAFHYTWTLLGIPFVLILGLIVLRWFIALPPRTRILFGAAAFLFVSGAIGIEMINSAIRYATTGRTLQYTLFTALEEALEFGGVLMFLYGLTDYLGARAALLRVSFSRRTLRA